MVVQPANDGQKCRPSSVSAPICSPVVPPPECLSSAAPRCVSPTPPRIHARIIRGHFIAGGAATRFRLNAGGDLPLGYRSVHLMCGKHILSEAENWYIPGRLTSAMNDALGHGDTPFGRVILPLSPRRHNLSVRALWDGFGPPPVTVLRHGALVIDGQGSPLAEICESYRAILVTGVRPSFLQMLPLPRAIATRLKPRP